MICQNYKTATLLVVIALQTTEIDQIGAIFPLWETLIQSKQIFCFGISLDVIKEKLFEILQQVYDSKQNHI